MSITLVHSKVKAEKVADVEAGIQRLVPALEQAQGPGVTHGFDSMTV